MLVLPAFERRQLVELARREAPREACALAIAGVSLVIGVVALENVADEPEESFELSSVGATLNAILRASLPPQLSLLHFHSHTRGPAHPSSGDLRYSLPGETLLLYSVELDELRAFVLEPGGELDRRRVRAVELAVA